MADDDRVGDPVGSAIVGLTEDELRQAREKNGAHRDQKNKGNGAHAASSGTMRFKLVPFRDLKPTDDRRDLVKDFIPRTGLAVIWGPPKSLKSFFAADLMMHVALGWDYCGRRVIQGPVVYCAFEGAHGHKARAEAFRRHHGLRDDDDVPFYLISVPMDLIADVPDLIDCIRRQIPNGQPPASVVFDTLNRSLHGSESKDEDMGAYVQAAGHVIDAFQCLVAIVHHCGIDDKRPRGHTSLTGAADAQIAAKRDGQTVTATVEWMKDGAEGATVSHRLEVIEVGTDQDGEPITSCVLVPIEAQASHRTERRLSDRQKLAMAALTRVVASKGEPLPVSFGLPTSIMAVHADHWRDEMMRSGAIPPDHKNPRTEFLRQRESLQARKLIAMRDEHVWLV